MTKTEQGLTNLLTWMGDHNRRLLLERPDLPLLYESGVFYQREPREVWCDFLAMLEQGHEDCDGLAPARAGELMARGWQAMSPEDGGWEHAQILRPRSIPASVILKTRGTRGRPNLYHCLVLYEVGGILWLDDPSARLGMFGERRYHPYNSRPADHYFRRGRGGSPSARRAA